MSKFTDRALRASAMTFVGVVMGGSVFLPFAARRGNETAEKILEFLYPPTPADYLRSACAQAMQEYQKTGKSVTIPIRSSASPDRPSMGCSVEQVRPVP